MQELLGYADWRNFLNAIAKAKESCKTTNEAVSDHFVDVNKTILMPKGASKIVEDFMLTRYACYLIAQNGDLKPSYRLPMYTYNVYLSVPTPRSFASCGVSDTIPAAGIGG